MSNTLEFTLGAKGHAVSATLDELQFAFDLQPQEKGDLLVTVTNSKGKSPPVKIGTVTTLDLVAHWPMNEGSGTTLVDAIGGSPLFIATGAPRWNNDTPGSQAGS